MQLYSELLEFSHTNFLIVNNDKTIAPVGWRQICYKTLHSVSGFFNGGGPYAKSNNPMVRSQRVKPGVCEVLILGNDDRPIFLCPLIKELVRLSLESQFVDVLDLPPGQLFFQPFRKGLWYILVKQNPLKLLRHEQLPAPHL